MLKGILTAILLSFLLTLAPDVTAQEIEPPPFPLEDTSTIFPAGIEVVDMRLMHNPNTYENGFFVSLDQSAVINLEGRQYPFPFNTDGYEHARAYTRSIFNDNLLIEIRDWQAEKESLYWMLNLDMGVYTQLDERPEQLETLCGAVPLAEARAGDWVLIEEAGQQHFCHIETGIQTPPLPENYHGWLKLRANIDSDYVFLRTFPSAENLATLFAFNTQTDDLIQIGNIDYPDEENLGETIEKQVSETQYLYQIRIPDVPANRFITYFIDIAEPHISQTPFVGTYYPNPPRVIMRNEIQDEETGLPICEWTSFDLLNQMLTSYRLNSRCFYEFARFDAHYYTRVWNEDDPASVDVISVNSAAGDYTILYSGEVENVLWVSPAERFIALVLDTNGQIDTPPGSPGRVGRYEGSQFTLIDRYEGRIIYQTPATVAGMDSSYRPRVKEHENGWIEIQEQTHATLINVLDETLEPRIIHGYLGQALEDDWYFLFAPESEWVTEFGDVMSLSIYNFTTQQEIPLIDITVDGYWIDNWFIYAAYTSEEAYWSDYTFPYLGDGIFEFGFSFGWYYYPDEYSPPFLNYVQYHIRVPEMVEEE